MNTRHIWWTITPTLFEEILLDEIPICPVRQSIHIYIYKSIYLSIYLCLCLCLCLCVCAMGCESFCIVKGCCFITSESSFHNGMQTLWKQHVLANSDSEQSKNVIHIVITSLAKIYLSRQLEFYRNTNEWILSTHTSETKNPKWLNFECYHKWIARIWIEIARSLFDVYIFFSFFSGNKELLYILIRLWFLYNLYDKNYMVFLLCCFVLFRFIRTHTHTRWIQLSLFSFFLDAVKRRIVWMFCLCQDCW